MDDLTPLVGVIGAIVGGAIGLLGQRMNLKEQRRKDQREKVVELLRVADSLWIAADRCVEPDSKKDVVLQALEELVPLNAEIGHRAEFLNLTAPWLLQQRALQLCVAAQFLLIEATAFVYVRADGQPVETDKYALRREAFFAAREKLVEQARPDVAHTPWWTKRRWRFLVPPATRRKLPPT